MKHTVLSNPSDPLMGQIAMRMPADMHTHLRVGSMLNLVAPMVARRFAMAIIMPNTKPPITGWKAAQKYRDEILNAIPGGIHTHFKPLMTLYLTDKLDFRELYTGEEESIICAVKYYPRGLTTNSDDGVKDPTSLWTENSGPYKMLRACVDTGKVLLLHAADGFTRADVMVRSTQYAAGDELDPYHQEPYFIQETLPHIRDAHPALKISVEHISTAEGAAYLRQNGGPLLGCSITAQHLLLDRRDTHRGGLRPHRFWWPIIQENRHKQAIRELACGGHCFVWLGSDSAPHRRSSKETDCCSGGVLTAHAGIELYADAFSEMKALDQRFEDFASVNGPRFFGIPPSERVITLIQKSWTVKQQFATDDGSGDTVYPFKLGEQISWRLAE